MTNIRQINANYCGMIESEEDSQVNAILMTGYFLL